MRLTIYIPTFGRPASCVEQVRAIAAQQGLCDLAVTVVVSINGDDSYDLAGLRQAGADQIIERRANLGGNANICLGFEHVRGGDYLWILSDDDIIRPGALARLAHLMVERPDLIVASTSATSDATLECQDERALLSAGGHIDLISSTIYRTDVIAPFVETAFALIVTSYPHAGAIIAMMRSRGLTLCTVLPADDLVDRNRSIASVTAISRSDAGVRQGAAFFGGGLLSTLGDHNSFSDREFVRWWAMHWHRASMFRRANSVQQTWVDRLALANPATAALRLASSLPWWRAKERLRPRV